MTPKCPVRFGLSVRNVKAENLDMKVVISDEVFAESSCDDLVLLSIMAFGYQGRHDIITDPVVNHEFEPAEGTKLSEWLEKQSNALAEEIRFTLRMGVEEGIGEVGVKDEIYITAEGESVWGDEPPRLSLQDAWLLLDRSLHILVENGRNDGKFLETMFKRLLGRSYWKPVKKALDHEWIHIENGGGIGEMKKVVDSLIDDPVGSTRTCAVFDSDAPEPQKPSDASEALREKCEECSLDHHQLQRRAIENYLSREALKASAEFLSEPAKSDRREVADTFSGMNRGQRHHFHMKKGFSEDEVDEPPIPFHTLDKKDREYLKRAFGSDIGDLFYEEDFEISDVWLLKDFRKSDRDEFVKIQHMISRKI